MQLHGFNFLTKSLAVSIYKVCYIGSNTSQQRYVAHINTAYCAAELSTMLADIAQRIGGQVLNTAAKDYQPQGASATLMIAEGNEGTSAGLSAEASAEMSAEVSQESNAQGNAKHLADLHSSSVVSHLDKSHLCVHTYPEELFTDNIAIFRADIEISSCGLISPLTVLNALLDQYQPDVTTIDYRIRGYSRQECKDKQFTDHSIQSIQQYIGSDVLANYRRYDQNITHANIFHTSLMTETLRNENIYQFANQQFNPAINESIKAQLMAEMTTIFTANANDFTG